MVLSLRCEAPGSKPRKVAELYRAPQSVQSFLQCGPLEAARDTCHRRSWIRLWRGVWRRRYDQSSTRALPFDWHLITALAQVLGEVTEGTDRRLPGRSETRNHHELKHLVDPATLGWNRMDAALDGEPDPPRNRVRLSWANNPPVCARKRDPPCSRTSVSAIITFARTLNIGKTSLPTVRRKQLCSRRSCRALDQGVT